MHYEVKGGSVALFPCCSFEEPYLRFTSRFPDVVIANLASMANPGGLVL